MRASSDASPLTLAEARSLLGLAGPTDRPATVAAFRTAIKAARPDLPGGDALRFRRLIEAYELVLAAGPTSVRRPRPGAPLVPSLPVVGLDVRQALLGGFVELDLPGRRLRIAVPPGLRSGDRLRLRGAGPGDADLRLPVLIRPTDGVVALGDDLFMNWTVPERLLDDGGRVEIETWAGPRAAWVVAGLEPPVRLRLRDLGLPARGAHAQGSLFVTLQPAADAPSVTADRLARFAALWTADPIAA